jgi:2-polyprenyl-3-methyl-5-hydroxy-6-metoxy-1,4-benzoquinol methylase
VKTEPTNLKTSICLICKQQSNAVFAARILNKYEAQYFRCSQCGFIQTERPHWLGEAYESAITSLDVGLVRRNLDFAEITQRIIDQCFEREARFLDFAGGYGLFVRLMRDKGYDFFRQDKFCPNLFAANHDLNDLPPSTRFELVTAFEVFEHLPDPCQEVQRMLELSDSVFFSTEIVPSSPIAGAEDWWYFAPETGQHISFFSRKALEILAAQLNCHLWTDRHMAHLLTRKSLKADPFASDGRLSRLMSRAMRKLGLRKHQPMKSLIEDDYESARKKARGQANQS